MKRKGTKIFEEFRKFLRKHDIDGRDSHKGNSFWRLKSGFVIFFESEHVMRIYDSRVRDYRYFRVKHLSCVLAVLCNPHFGILRRSCLQGSIMPNYDYYEIQKPTEREYFCYQCSGGMSLGQLHSSFTLMNLGFGYSYSNQ